MIKFNIYLKVIFHKKDSKMVITPFNESNQINFDSIGLSYDYTSALQDFNAGFRKLLKNKKVKNVLYFILGLILSPIAIVLSPLGHLYLLREYYISKKFYNKMLSTFDSITDKTALEKEELKSLNEILVNTQTLLDKLHLLPAFPIYAKILFPFVWFVTLEKKQLIQFELKIRLILHPEINEIPLNYDEIIELRECLKDFDLPKYSEEIG